MTPEEFKELGRGYYKLKQYHKAIEAFTQGIEIAPSPGLYDYRAASYDKLEDYNAAVKDGREMIKLDKKDIKGYLRTASVLEKMEKQDVALGIYKYGMKNVPVGDKNFKVRAASHQSYYRSLTCSQLLQQLHDKTTRRLSPAKSVDPLTVLPVELAEMVLEYMSFKHTVNCMRVSKGWRDYLAKLPRLWVHLDLSGAKRPVSRSFVSKAVRRSDSKLTRVTVHRLERMDILKNIAIACKHLVELEFISFPHALSESLIENVRYASSLKKLVIHPEISLDTATQLFRYRPELEHVCFNRINPSGRRAAWQGPFDALRILHLSLPPDKASGENLNFGTLFGQIPAVTSLTLSNMYFLNGLDLQTGSSFSRLPLTTLILKQFGNGFMFPPLPPTLEKFVFESIDLLKMTISQRILLRCRLPALTHLGLSDVQGMCADRMEELLDTYTDGSGYDESQVQILENAAPLQHLRIHRVLLVESCTGLFKDANSLFVRSPRILTPALRRLDIAFMPCDDDEVECLLSYNITGLKSINLSCSQITGASIKMLADKLPSLKIIRADNCPKISGRDAIEYAQRKGITVNCSMIESKGGKKVRYG